MIGPIPSSQGLPRADFFQHGLVMYGGGFVNDFGKVRLCMSAGFGINSDASASWDEEKSVSAGFGKDGAVLGTWPTCNS